MRTGGAFFTPVGGHWQRPAALARARARRSGFTLDTSHAALFRSFAAAYPTLFGLAGDEGLELERYVEELGPAAEVAHVSNAVGDPRRGPGLRHRDGELDLDPIVARLGELVPYVVAEINEPDHRVSPNIKDGYRHVERALAPARRALAPAAAPAAARERSTGRRVIGRRDPVPDVLGARRPRSTARACSSPAARARSAAR